MISVFFMCYDIFPVWQFKLKRAWRFKYAEL